MCDLNKIKNCAKRFLYMDIVSNPQLPMFVYHPFTSCRYTSIGKNLKDLFKREDRVEWQSFLEEEIDKTDKLLRIIIMINKPYRLIFLKTIRPHLTIKEYSKLLANIWIETEFPNSDVNFSKKQLVELFTVADKNYLMSKEESKYLESLPDVVEIYRGVGINTSDNIRRLSWTTDLEKAKWFSNRFSEGHVYKMKIKKSKILAVFLGRGEHEVIINPEDIANYKKVLK